LVNTFLAMQIDINARKPVFDNTFAGLSGPAIMPIALRMAYQVAGAVNVPIIGVGGISGPEDVISFLMAGASAVEIGTALFRDPLVFERCIAGLEEFCEKEKITNISQIIGAAQPSRQFSAK